jgi:nicotinate-nucleotide pyrophosphorylase (carboxylating)
MTAAHPPASPELQALEELARRALAEDLGEAGDITSKRIVRAELPGRARIVAKSAGVLAGTGIATAVFRAVDPALSIDWKITDGQGLAAGGTVAELSGRARAILAGERVALNFLQQLSGVATLTAAFVAAAAPYGVKILCTRKTVPGLRALQRQAVAAGGGTLHRAGLHDAILIKTTHTGLAGGITEAIRRARAQPVMPVEVEVRTAQELDEALAARAESILLDNAGLEDVAAAVAATRGRAFLEVSGGVTLASVEAIAALRPDAISVGALTHSPPAVDLALRIAGPVGAGPRAS